MVTALLAIHAGATAWAIPSSAVTSVEPFHEGSADDALDVLALLGAAPADAGQVPRVLVVEVSGERLRVLVRGALTLTETTAESLLPLPPALETATPFVTHIAVVDGRPALFVVSPERLLAAAHHRNSIRPPFTTPLEVAHAEDSDA